MFDEESKRSQSLRPLFLKIKKCKIIGEKEKIVKIDKESHVEIVILFITRRLRSEWIRFINKRNLEFNERRRRQIQRGPSEANEGIREIGRRKIIKINKNLAVQWIVRAQVQTALNSVTRTLDCRGLIKNTNYRW